MTVLKIFGREPALIIGFVAAVFSVLAAVNLSWLNAGQAAAVTGLIGAGIMAWATRPSAPAMYVGVLNAAVTLFGEYGLHWTQEGIAAASGLILASFALFSVRPQVTPVIDPAPTVPAVGKVR